jgi:hypothetical protein
LECRPPKAAQKAWAGGFKPFEDNYLRFGLGVDFPWGRLASRHTFSEKEPIMRHFLTLPIALLLLLGGSLGCSGGDPSATTDEAYAALNSGDAAGAAKKFETALAELKPGAEGYLRAKLGHVEALIETDPDRAQQEFLDLVGSGAAIGAEHFRTIGAKMTKQKKYSQAVAVLDVGHKKFPDDKKIREQIDVVKAEAEKAGDPEAVEKLKSLGYIGE